MYWHGGAWWAWLSIAVALVVFWGLAIAAGAAVTRGRRAGGRRPRPLENHLAEQLARGRIGPKEYAEALLAVNGAPTAMREAPRGPVRRRPATGGRWNAPGPRRAGAHLAGRGMHGSR